MSDEVDLIVTMPRETVRRLMVLTEIQGLTLTVIVSRAFALYEATQGFNGPGTLLVAIRSDGIKKQFILTP